MGKTRSVYNKEYYRKHKDRLLAAANQRYAENQEQILEKRRAFVASNLEKIRAQQRAYYEEHRDECRSRCKRYYEEHKDEVRTYKREWMRKRLADPQFRTISRLRRNLLRAFKQFSENGKCGTSRKYGIDYKAIFDRLGPCPGDPAAYHIDHIIPLSLFNFDDPEEVKQAFAPANHQWLLAEDNLSKGDGLPTLDPSDPLYPVLLAHLRPDQQS